VKKQSIIIFGTGEFGRNIYHMYKEKYEILSFCDNNIAKQTQKIFDIKIISPLELQELNYDKIIIASTYVEDIYSQLTNNLKISPSKIKKLYVNESKIQFYSKETREKSELFMFFIAKLLKQNHITYYLDHGTLLGIIRDNALIPWDKDIDFAVLAKDEQKIYKLLNETLPFYQHPKCIENKWKYKIAKEQLTLGNKEIDAIVELQIYNDSKYQDDLIALDLMFRYEYNNELHWKVANKHLKVNLDISLPTVDIKFKDHILQVPNKTYNYLENLFGDWKTPVKEWSYDYYTNNEEIMDK